MIILDYDSSRYQVEKNLGLIIFFNQNIMKVEFSWISQSKDSASRGFLTPFHTHFLVLMIMAIFKTMYLFSPSFVTCTLALFCNIILIYFLN